MNNGKEKLLEVVKWRIATLKTTFLPSNMVLVKILQVINLCQFSFLSYVLKILFLRTYQAYFLDMDTQFPYVK